MNYDASEQIPFFVYGTLIPGQPNDHLWGDGIRGVETAVFTHGMLFDLGYYPMLVEGGVGTVQGKLISVANGFYEEILNRLDYLEGYDPEQPDASDYRRVRREVNSQNGHTVFSWVYVGRLDLAEGFELIPGGDWLTHAASLRGLMDQWWETIHTVSGRHRGVENDGLSTPFPDEK